MDQGNINSFKSHYRRCLVNRYLAAIENKGDLKKINIHVKAAINMASMAWKEVTPCTISNCFKKVGFVKEHIQQPQQESSQLTVDRNVWESLQEHLGITYSFNEYVSVDSNIPTLQN